MPEFIAAWLRLYDAAQLALQGQAAPEALTDWYDEQHQLTADQRIAAWEAHRNRDEPGAPSATSEQRRGWSFCRCPRCMLRPSPRWKVRGYERSGRAGHTLDRVVGCR